MIAVTMGVAVFYWYMERDDYSLYYKLDIVETYSTLLFIPAIFLYFREVTGDKSWSALKISLFFVPPLLFATANAIGFLYAGEAQAVRFMKDVVENNGQVVFDNPFFYQMRFFISEYTYSLLLGLQAVSLLVYAVYRLLLYRRHLCDFFSNINEKGLRHHWMALGGIFVYLVLTFWAAESGYVLYVAYNYVVSVFMLLYAGTLYFICYHVSYGAYTSEKVSEHLVVDVEEPQEPQEQNPDEEHPKTYLKFLPRFNQVIDEEQIFLQKNLRLDDVAALVGTNRTYISHILKDEYHCTFWEFINHKRIEYAKEEMLRNPDSTVERLTEICGFSHGTAFSRAFRQCEGITFKEWQKELQ